MNHFKCFFINFFLSYILWPFIYRDPVEEENYFILILKQEEPVVIVNRIGRHTTGLPWTSVLNRSHPDHVKRDNILHTMWAQEWRNATALKIMFTLLQVRAALNYSHKVNKIYFDFDMIKLILILCGRSLSGWSCSCPRPCDWTVGLWLWTPSQKTLLASNQILLPTLQSGSL